MNRRANEARMSRGRWERILDRRYKHKISLTAASNSARCFYETVWRDARGQRRRLSGFLKSITNNFSLNQSSVSGTEGQTAASPSFVFLTIHNFLFLSQFCVSFHAFRFSVSCA